MESPNEAGAGLPGMGERVWDAAGGRRLGFFGVGSGAR